MPATHTTARKTFACTEGPNNHIGHGKCRAVWCKCECHSPAPMFEVVAELSVDVDGFDAWQAAQGMPATTPVAGIETIADFALAIEHSAHIALGDGRLF